MKQYSTKKQWNELSAKNKIIFWKAVFPNDEVFDMVVPVIPINRINEITIRIMIKFLGDDLDEITNTEDWCDEYKDDYKKEEFKNDEDDKDFNWMVQLKGEWREDEEGEKFRCESGCCGYSVRKKELVDALWSACVYKVNNL